MKFIILFLILQITFSYQTSDAIKYATKYCENYNPKYFNYKEKENEDVNFVSQSLFAGGESFQDVEEKID